VSVTVFVLALSFHSWFPRFGCPGVVIGKLVFVFFKFHIYNILLHIVHTHTRQIRSLLILTQEGKDSNQLYIVFNIYI
jgi:hypothetical protein